MSLFSVNTNTGALAALASLRSTTQSLTDTEAQISTGKKVGSASDNPAIYSIANTINANIAGLSAVSDSLNFGAQVVATASSAVTSINSVLSNLQQTVTSSNQSGISLSTLQTQVNAELTSINTYATDATFNGVNLLAANTGSGVTSNSLNVVQSVDGGVYSVANQINPTGGTTIQSLTDALGLTSLSVTGGASGNIGTNVAFGTGTDVFSTFNPSVAGGTNAAPTANTNSALQLTVNDTSSGTPVAKTFSFEFVDDATADIQLQSAPSTNNTVVAVHFNSSTDSTNQIVSHLQSALSSNGFGVVQQSDGSLNIVGRGLTQADFGTESAGAFTSGSSTTNGAPTATNGVTVTSLTTNQSAVTAVQSAVTTLNTISANLGAATQQISGIQSFTTSLSSALTAGVGALTDADLAAESAQLTSLQTKQQLATQALSIANSQPQSLLSLFKGG
jgi:flagellin